MHPQIKYVNFVQKLNTRLFLIGNINRSKGKRSSSGNNNYAFIGSVEVKDSQSKSMIMTHSQPGTTRPVSSSYPS